MTDQATPPSPPSAPTPSQPAETVTPKLRTDLIPEAIERKYLRPVLEDLANFMTTRTGAKHDLTSIELKIDGSNMSVPCNFQVTFPKDRACDYLIVHAGVIIPMPHGTIFQKAEQTPSPTQPSTDGTPPARPRPLPTIGDTPTNTPPNPSGPPKI